MTQPKTMSQLDADRQERLGCVDDVLRMLKMLDLVTCVTDVTEVLLLAEYVRTGAYAAVAWGKGESAG